MLRAVAAGLALCAGCLAGGAVAAGQYSVPGLGALRLEMPKGWQVHELPGPVSLYLQIRPETGDAFDLQVSATWLQPDQMADLARAPVSKRVEGMANALLPRAVETAAPLTELKGAQLAGQYFSLTARAAPEGQPRYLTQGMLSGAVGVAVFTLLHRERDAPEIKQTLDMLAGAALTRDAATALPLAQDALRTAELPNRYELWVPASRIYMVLPRGRLVPLKNSLGGSASNPRYFYFVDRAFNVSGWFEPAAKFEGAQKFWQEEVKGWSEKGLPAPIDVAFAKVGGWEATLYDSPSATGSNSHIRAHWAQDGTWIDLHLSLASGRSSADARAALQAYLKGVLVRQR